MEITVKASPQVVTLGKALKLAEQWVNNMSGSMAQELPETQIESRPARLGLGAKITPHLRVKASTDPIERKLRAKLDAEKKRAAQNLEEANPIKRNADDEEDSDEFDSRASSFAKKRPQISNGILQEKKKRK